MTKVSDEDLAFDTLRTVCAELTPDLAADLVEKCYAIQKVQQFSSEHAIPAQMMDRLIDDYVDKLMAPDVDGAGA